MRGLTLVWPIMSRPRLRSSGLVLLVVVLAAGAGTGGYALVRSMRAGHKPPRVSATPVPAALTQATAVPASAAPSSAAPVVSAAGVGAALRAVLADPRLGARLLAEVRDAATGRVLYAQQAGTPAAPASTAKLLTAAAVLTVHEPTDRITTRVVAGSGGALVLVGGGDPTLTGADKGKPGAYPDAARITDLAAQIARALARQHRTATRIVVDDSLFVGPSVAPDWAPEDVPSDYAAPITAVMTDGGRAAPGDLTRSTAPDLAAGHELAAALGAANLPVVRGSAPAAGATALASVASAPMSELVAQMLQSSDNVIAECLGREVALAEGRPASFAGAAAAIRAVLGRLGIDSGAGMRDASGLAAADRLTAATLAAVLRLLAGAAHPQLHDVLAGLPVAAWSGTLGDRYLTGASAAGAGVVRAKTGTLSAVSALAGLVHDRDGRLLVFAFVADRVGDLAASEAALDAVAGALARCGCS